VPQHADGCAQFGGRDPRLVRRDHVPHPGKLEDNRVRLPDLLFAVESGDDLHAAQAQGVGDDETLLTHAHGAVDIGERQPRKMFRQTPCTEVGGVPGFQAI
jgi:ribosomal protein L27